MASHQLDRSHADSLRVAENVTYKIRSIDENSVTVQKCLGESTKTREEKIPRSKVDQLSLKLVKEGQDVTLRLHNGLVCFKPGPTIAQKLSRRHGVNR